MIDPNKSELSGPWGWAAKRLGIPPWGQILILLLIGQAYIIWNTHSDVSEIKGTLRSLPISISQDLLSQAKDDVSANNIPRALQSLDSAQNLLVRSASKHIPAKPDDFQAIISDLNILSRTPELSKRANGTRVVLANYKSSLKPLPPRLTGKQVTRDKGFILTAEAASLDESSAPGTIFIAIPGATWDWVTTPFYRRLEGTPHASSVSNIEFWGAAQELDGFRWNHVVFVGTSIRYEGGELEVNDTRFIGCTFQMVDSPRSAKLATHVTLDQPYLKLGPND